MSKTKRNVPKARNYHCLNAIINRPSAGSMGDARKEQSRGLCRGRQEYDEDDCDEFETLKEATLEMEMYLSGNKEA